MPNDEAAMDSIARKGLIVFRNEAEELKRWPLRRMKLAREGDIVDYYHVVVTRASNNE